MQKFVVLTHNKLAIVCSMHCSDSLLCTDYTNTCTTIRTQRSLHLHINIAIFNVNQVTAFTKSD